MVYKKKKKVKPSCHCCCQRPKSHYCPNQKEGSQKISKKVKPQPEEPKNVIQFLSRTTEIHKYVKINTQLIRFHFWRVLCGNKHEPKSGILLCFCQSTSTNYRHATAANVCLFILYQRWVNEYMQILNVAFLRRQRHLRRIRVAPYTWTIPRPAESWFDIHYLSPLLFLQPFVVVFVFLFLPNLQLTWSWSGYRSHLPHLLDYRILA